MYYATTRLYVNADRTRIVSEDSPDATFLLAAVGQPVDMATAQRLGLLDAPEPVAEPLLEAKMVQPVADKAVRRRRTK